MNVQNFVKEAFRTSRKFSQKSFHNLHFNRNYLLIITIYYDFDLYFFRWLEINAIMHLLVHYIYIDCNLQQNKAHSALAPTTRAPFVGNSFFLLSN